MSQEVNQETGYTCQLGPVEEGWYFKYPFTKVSSTPKRMKIVYVQKNADYDTHALYVGPIDIPMPDDMAQKLYLELKEEAKEAQQAAYEEWVQFYSWR